MAVTQKKHHGSSPKPPVEESDNEHKEELGKASTNEENTDDGAIYASPKPPVEENDDKHEEEIDKASVKPRKQKQNDSTSLKEDVYVETAKMFKCDICEVNFKGENELEDHIQDWH